MKTILCAILAVAALSFSGCSKLQAVYKATTTNVSAQTSDQLIVNAEKATLIAKDTMDTFLRLEYQHRAAYLAISPTIHQFAEKLRADKNGNKIQDGIDILVTARVATKSFKANRTSDNEANLRTAWAALQSVIDDCKKYSALALKQPTAQNGP